MLGAYSSKKSSSILPTMLLRDPDDTPHWLGTSQRGLNKRIQAGLFAILITAIWILTFLPWRPHNLPTASDITYYQSPASPQAPYAYVTLLAPNPKLDYLPSTPDSEDEYFIGTRVLAYQLLHQPSTRTTTSIPFIVICTDDVKDSKIQRLRSDGATVIIVEKIRQEWMKSATLRWRDILSKLHMLKLIQYEKLLFLDSDMLIAKRMDTIFVDPTTAPLTPNATLAKWDEGHLPDEYIFSAQTYIDRRDHLWPFPPGLGFSGGFFLLRPSMTLFDYYMRIASLPGRFDSDAMEQSLLNYAHRKDGPMPWAEINYRYVTSWPTMKEVRKGAHALHEKFWDHDIRMDDELRDMWFMKKGEMLGFYEQRDSKGLPV